mmetsp:Transcript_29521/g.41837  ORF Transcript_29521/g.41837 Transcript_29521/m.41837 type:complete len:206 (-) Transcript_29521:1237-1854(-)
MDSIHKHACEAPPTILTTTKFVVGWSCIIQMKQKSTHSKKQVLRFQITVCYTLVVHVFHSQQQNLTQMSRIVFSVMVLFNDPIEHVTPTHVIHDQEEVILLFIKINELHDVFVDERLHNGDFVHDGFIVAGFEALPFDDFDGVDVLCFIVDTLPDGCEGSLAEFGFEFVDVPEGDFWDAAETFEVGIGLASSEKTVVVVSGYHLL